MKKYFGTDGIRGEANKELTPELAFKIGRAAGSVLKEKSGSTEKRVHIGRDTRISGEMLEYALISGFVSVGVSVVRHGVIPTPAIAHITKNDSALAGIMISASHNPYQDNGIKLFGNDGYKISDELEESIEELIDNDTNERVIGSEIGTVIETKEGRDWYKRYVENTITHRLDGMNIVLDTANGATVGLANEIFTSLGANVTVIGNEPNGVNINHGVGSTHPEAIQQKVKELNADIGFSFDGDGDRLIVVDENGEIRDGDSILYVCGVNMHQKGKLKDGMVVSTVMSNLGFYRALEKEGLKSVATSVGDRYVSEEMRKNAYSLGGEQSGHLIFSEYSTTGDGILSAVQVAVILKETNQAFSSLCKPMTIYPQKLTNVKVIEKGKVMNNDLVKEAIERVSNALGSNGRVLVRPSGTEHLIRVMVEAVDEETCEKSVDEIVQVVMNV